MVMNKMVVTFYWGLACAVQLSEGTDKVYFEVGLKDLARASILTLTFLDNASNFKRTHAFLMQVWETMYRHMYNLYVSHTPLNEDILVGVKSMPNK